MLSAQEVSKVLLHFRAEFHPLIPTHHPTTVACNFHFSSSQVIVPLHSFHILAIFSGVSSSFILFSKLQELNSRLVLLFPAH